MIVTIPGMKLVSEANRRDKWGGIRRARQQRAIAAMMFRARGYPIGFPIVVTVTRIAPRELDAHDNLPRSAKAVIDGIADWLGVSDRHPGITWRVEQRKGRVREYAVEIRIEAREEARST